MSTGDKGGPAVDSRQRSDVDSREFPAQLRRSVPVRVVPNPFVGQATITFDLPEAGYVALSIHDVTGRKVHEAPPTWMDAGAQQLAWSPDELGANAGSISSGTYFYQLRVTGPGTVSGTGPAPIALETGRIQHVR